jgi:hypothetical protein
MGKADYHDSRPLGYCNPNDGHYLKGISRRRVVAGPMPAEVTSAGFHVSFGPVATF